MFFNKLLYQKQQTQASEPPGEVAAYGREKGIAAGSDLVEIDVHKTKDGAIVYTYENLALVDKNPTSVMARSAGGDQSLYTPEVYATLAGVTNAVAVYEPTLQQLTLVYPDGSSTKKANQSTS